MTAKPTIDDVKELLPLYALGVLDDDEMRLVERALAHDPAVALELAAAESTIGQLGSLCAPVTPGPEVLARLVASVGAGPFERLSSRMAHLFDVTVDRARELLGLVERPASWEPAAPGILLVHFDGGPAFAHADCGFIRIDAGGMFPPHTHLGEEVIIVMAGHLRDIDGRVLGPGDESIQSEGSSHHLVVEGDEPCMYATRAANGIAIGGVRAVAPGRQPK